MKGSGQWVTGADWGAGPSSGVAGRTEHRGGIMIHSEARSRKWLHFWLGLVIEVESKVWVDTGRQYRHGDRRWRRSQG